MTDCIIELQINSVRSRGASGGAIFAGHTHVGRQYVVVCDFKLMRDASLVHKGQTWQVSGQLELRPVVYGEECRMEPHIIASSAEMLRPSGRNVIAWIAANPDCRGVGHVKAAKLYERFGTTLVDLIEARDLVALGEVISVESAESICHAFEKSAVGQTLTWLDALSIPRAIAQKVVSFYKGDARAKLEANPYLLCNFAANWKAIDSVAMSRFKLDEHDVRRLDSVVEEALYLALKGGHTCLPRDELKRRVAMMLESSSLATTALACNSSRWTQFENIYQTCGLAVIERYIASHLHAASKNNSEMGQMGLEFWEAPSTAHVQKLLQEFERVEGIELSAEQRAAVEVSSLNSLSLILGGAGTGKTTVLKALYAVLDETVGLGIYQLALAGRAAQRMGEATGRPSMTIAAFLNSVAPEALDSNSIVVVDEMSMVDAMLMYRLLRAIPLGVRIVLVGDPAQLPPIGPGLVLHALVGLPDIAQTELKVVKRQSSESGIPKIAEAVRNHALPVFREYSGEGVGVSVIECSETDLTNRVTQLYGEIGGTGQDYSVQVLSITKRNAGGVHEMNSMLHGMYSRAAEPIIYTHPDFGLASAKTTVGGSFDCQLRVGDLVMYTKNDYHLGLRNGSLGKIIDAVASVEGDFEAPCCLCDFEGLLVKLNFLQLEFVSHAYSITVHKSQGSQFGRVIVPVTDGRLLDQSLIYTAITRGINQVILVGNIAAAFIAIARPPAVNSRHVGLPRMLLSERNSPPERIRASA